MTVVMGKRLVISILVFLTSAAAFGAGPANKPLKATVAPVRTSNKAGTARRILLRDGFALAGVDGRLVIHDSNEDNQESATDKWFFELDSDLSDGRGLIKAGADLELLPSSYLERMIADVNNAPGASYRLWGRVTQYRGQNFIFPTFFLPLAETKTPKLSTSQKSQQQKDRPKINEPNDVLTIPKELIDKLPDRKKMIEHRTPEEQSKEEKGEVGGKTKQEQDSVLADRIGFIRDTDHKTQETWRKVSFVLDAIGRTEPKISLRLLPCQALEQAEDKQSAALEALRFKIAGTVTMYKGKDYLLLQRATRVYSHGNFPG